MSSIKFKPTGVKHDAHSINYRFSNDIPSQRINNAYYFQTFPDKYDMYTEHQETSQQYASPDTIDATEIYKQSHLTLPLFDPNVYTPLMSRNPDVTHNPPLNLIIPGNRIVPSKQNLSQVMIAIVLFLSFIYFFKKLVNRFNTRFD